MLREKICENQGNFHFKALRENYKGANFYGLAYNFHGHIRQFFRSYRIVSPKNAERGKACALPLFAKAKIGLLFGSAKTRCFVPRTGKARAARGGEEITRKEGNAEWQAKGGFFKA